MFMKLIFLSRLFQELNAFVSRKTNILEKKKSLKENKFIENVFLINNLCLQISLIKKREIDTYNP